MGTAPEQPLTAVASEPANVLQAMADAVVAIDGSGRVTFWGPGAASLYGVPAAEALGRQLTDFYSYQWTSAAEEQEALAALEREGRWRGRNIHVLRTGAVRHVESTITVLRDGAGQPAGMMAVIRDESERIEAERARRAAEDALRASALRYRSLFANMTEGFAMGEAICDASGAPTDFRFLEMNDAFERQSGLSRERALGRPMREVRPGLEEEWIRRYCAVAQGAPPCRLERYDEELERHFSIYCYSPVPGRFAILLSDVTDRKRADEERRAGEARYRALVDLSPEAILVRQAGLVVLANPAAMALFGARSADELIGRDSLDLFEEPHGPILERLAILEAGGRVPPRESRVHRLDGGIRDVEVIGSGVPGPDGVAVQLVLRDITDRKRSEAILRDSEERARQRAAELEAVLDTVPAAVWISRDPRGDRIDANRFGAELLQLRPGENASITGPAADRPRHFTLRRDGHALDSDELPIQRSARRGEEIRGAEFDLVFEDGEVRHLLGNAAPLRDPAGRPKGSVGAFIDVTERKAAETALLEADRRKTDFLAILSHELRNPLAPIRNSIYLLECAPPGGEAARRAREILKRQTDQLSRLVDDLLDISRITHGKIELKPARLDAREVVRRAYLDARNLFDQRDIQLLLAEPPEPVWVDADAARLSQMIGNLLHNALKFTPPRGEVQVRIACRGGWCELAVRDSGVGLERSELERIFDPFVQGQRARHGEGGLGLGLALVNDLAAKHGGSVRAESEGPGKGAEFVIQLPLAPAPAQRDAHRDGERPAAGLDVLIVEDNEDAAMTLGDLLELTGNRVRTASTGRAGLQRFDEAPPDVILCDIGLPDMSGHEVIRAVRAREGGGRTMAVALTGYAQPQDREEALGAGFDAHLPKPPPLEELHALLARVAAQRSASSAAASATRNTSA